MTITTAKKVIYNRWRNKYLWLVASIIATVLFLFVCEAFDNGWFCLKKIDVTSDFRATIILGIVGFYIGIIQTQIANDDFKRQLYSNFNERYDNLNNRLNKLHDKQENTCCEAKEAKSDEKVEENNNTFISKNDKTDYECVIDYLNLCAEEFYWFKKGRIDEDVWNHWHSGIKYHFNNSNKIKCIINKELGNQKDSFYGVDEIFKG